MEWEHTLIRGDIKDCLRDTFGRKSNVMIFGSLATGLAVVSSDMDIAVMGVKEPTSQAMDRLKEQLQQEIAF